MLLITLTKLAESTKNKAIFNHIYNTTVIYW